MQKDEILLKKQGENGIRSWPMEKSLDMDFKTNVTNMFRKLNGKL